MRDVRFAFLSLWLVCGGVTLAQDLEPRRWSHLPVGFNVAGVGYVYTDGDLALDPVLLVENAKVEGRTAIGSYVRILNFFGKTSQLDVLLPYQKMRWTGVVDGVPTTARREGFGDPRIRWSVNLIGAPALRGAEYQEFRKQHPKNTTFGVALAVTLPLGEYKEDKLLNLGANRFIIRPQLGVLQLHGPWSFELSGSVFFYTENDDFFEGNRLEQDPLYAMQGHIVRTFGRRAWASLSVGHALDGTNEVNGVPANDARDELLAAIAAGGRISGAQSLKVVYLRRRVLEDVGADTDNFVLAWSYRF